MIQKDDYTNRLAARLGPQVAIVRPANHNGISLPLVKESTGDSRTIYHHQQYPTAPLRSSRSVYFDNGNVGYQVAAVPPLPKVVAKEVYYTQDMKGSYMSDQGNHREYNMRSSSSHITGSPGQLSGRYPVPGSSRIVAQGSNTDREFDLMRASRISHQRETVIKGEPREVGRVNLGAIQRETKDLQPVLVSVNTTEKTSQSDFTNIRQMLIDCFKRIVLMGMENDRLVAKNSDLGQVIAELKARVQTLELEVADYDVIVTERAVYKSKVESLEIKIKELIAERRSYSMKIETYEHNLSTIQTLESQIAMYKRNEGQFRESIGLMERDLAELPKILGDNEILIQTNSQLVAEIEALRRSSNDLHSSQITMLATENERLQNELRDLKDKITLLATENERLQTLKQELQILKDQIAMLATENERLMVTRKELEDNHKYKVESMQQPFDQLNRQLKELQAAKDRLSNEVRLKTEEINHLKRELDANRLNMNGLVSRNDYENLLSEVKRITADRDHHLKSYQQLITVHAELENRFMNRDKELSQYKIEIEELRLKGNTEKDNLRRSNVHLENQLRESVGKMASIEDLEKKILLKEEEITRLMTEITYLTSDIQKLQPYIYELEDENGQLKGEIKELDMILQQRDATISDFSATVMRLEMQINSMVSKETHDSTVSRLQKEIGDMAQTVKRLEGDLQRKDLELESLTHAKNSMESQIRSLEANNQGLSRQVGELQIEISNLKFENSQ